MYSLVLVDVKGRTTVCQPLNYTGLGVPHVHETLFERTRFHRVNSHEIYYICRVDGCIQ